MGVNGVLASLPDEAAQRAALKPLIKGHLAAWDPVAQKEVWRVQHKGPWNGGVLSTASNLVFQGTADGRFVAYKADTGDVLWSSPTHTGVVAPPITYEIEGEQYVTVMAGWGGAFALVAGYFVQPESVPNLSRILTFKLGGAAQLPDDEWTAPELPAPPAQTASTEIVEQGRDVYARFCMWCHGDSAVSGGLVADLRSSGALHDDSWGEIVLEGTLADAGMASFGQHLTAQDAEAVRAYVIREAHRAVVAANP